MGASGVSGQGGHFFLVCQPWFSVCPPCHRPIRNGCPHCPP